MLKLKIFTVFVLACLFLSMFSALPFHYIPSVYASNTTMLYPSGTNQAKYGQSGTGTSAYTSPDNAGTNMSQTMYNNIQSENMVYAYASATCTTDKRYADIAQVFTFNTASISGTITDIVLYWKGYMNGSGGDVAYYHLQDYKASSWETWVTLPSSSNTEYTKDLGNGSAYFYSATWIKFGTYGSDKYTSGDNSSILNSYTDYAVLLITYTPKPMYLTINSATHGTTSPSPGTYSETANSVQNITALPSTNYNLSSWTVNGQSYGPSNPLSITMNANYTVTPAFTLLPAGISAVPFGESTGSTNYNTYFNGTPTGGESCLYFCYQNSTYYGGGSPKWAYMARAYDTIHYKWTNPVYIANSTPDGHYAPSTSILPDGRLIVLYGYQGPLFYRISTYNASTATNTTLLISNWGQEYSFAHFGTINNNGQYVGPGGLGAISYPAPFRFTDKLLVFGRSGTAANGDWTYVTWMKGASAFNYSVSGDLILEQNSPYHEPAGYYSMYPVMSRQGNTLFWASPSWNVTKNSEYNIYFCYSADEGLTWKTITGQSLFGINSSGASGSFCIPIQNTLVYSRSASARLRVNGMVLDANDKPSIETWENNITVGLGNSATHFILSYSSTLGSSGSWTYSKALDNNTSQVITGNFGAYYFDTYYNEPAFWDTGNSTNDYMTYYVQSPTSLNKFVAVYHDPTDVVFSMSSENVVDAPQFYNAITQEDWFNILGKYTPGAYKSAYMSASTIYACQFTANQTLRITGLDAYTNASYVTWQGALYNVTGTGMSRDFKLIASSGQQGTSSSTPGTWTNWAGTPLSFTSEPLVIAGHQYLLAIRTNSSNSINYYYDTSTMMNQSFSYSYTWVNGASFPNEITAHQVSTGLMNRSITIDAFPTYLMVRGAGAPLKTVFISPYSAIMDVGQSRLFVSNATGGFPPYTYRWYQNGVLKATTANYTYTPSSAGSYSIYLNVTDLGNSHVKSNVVSVTVNTTPSVSISPTSVTLDDGQKQLFTAYVSGGTTPYSYQWYLNGASVSGATSATWTFTPSSIGTYQVYFNVTDSVNMQCKSNITIVTVNPLPSVTVSPTSKTIDLGQSKTFTSTVTNGTYPYTYQWYLNSSPVSDAINPTWTLTPNSTGTYQIYLIITDNVAESATSNTATVTVNLALSVTVSPVSVVMDVGQSQLFTTNPVGGTSPFAYQWYLNSAPVSGATSVTWTFIPNSPGTYTIYVIVTDSADVDPSARSPSVQVIVNSAPTVAILPGSVVMNAGQSRLFTCSVSGGTSPYIYQWYLDGTPVSGATDPTWTFTPSSVGSFNVYVDVTDNVGFGAKSNNASVIVIPPVASIEGMVGVTGFKLVFKDTMNNSLSSPVTINYYWSFSMDRWNGTQWVASGISGSSTPVVGYVIPGLTTVDLPYYVYVLNSSGLNAVAWGDWLRISFTFHWIYGSSDYAVAYVAKLNVHPADVAGVALVAFPYLGADLVVNSKDFGAIAANWLAPVPSGTDPTSLLARADINADGAVNSKDIALIAANWLATWTNTPPS